MALLIEDSPFTLVKMYSFSNCNQKKVILNKIMDIMEFKVAYPADRAFVGAEFVSPDEWWDRCPTSFEVSHLNVLLKFNNSNPLLYIWRSLNVKGNIPSTNHTTVLTLELIFGLVLTCLNWSMECFLFFTF